MRRDPARPPPGTDLAWRSNLLVCVFGSFATAVAMTLLLPFLPVYVGMLGVRDHGAVMQWSAVAFSATFLAAGLTAPLWGWMADRWGRKPMLLRASLGMAICMSLIGMVQDVGQLVALRLLAGLVGGYGSGSVVLVATQTPKRHATWALGLLSSGLMAGNLAGPLLGGVLPPLIGLRQTFLLAGLLILAAFVVTLLLVREAPRPPRPAGPLPGAWAQVPDRRAVAGMLGVGMLLMLATLSIEPIVTLYVARLMPRGAPVTMMSGAILSATALGSMLAAPVAGRLADRIGPRRVVAWGLVASAVLLLPQAMVRSAWQLLGLRFAMGLTLGGLSPAITSLIRHAVPERVAGRILALNTSAQYAGFVAGPLLGGFVGAHLGMRAVFLATSLVMLGGAVLAATGTGRPDDEAATPIATSRRGHPGPGRMPS